MMIFLPRLTPYVDVSWLLCDAVAQIFRAREAMTN